MLIFQLTYPLVLSLWWQWGKRQWRWLALKRIVYFNLLPNLYNYIGITTWWQTSSASTSVYSTQGLCVHAPFRRRLQRRRRPRCRRNQNIQKHIIIIVVVVGLLIQIGIQTQTIDRLNGCVCMTFLLTWYILQTGNEELQYLVFIRCSHAIIAPTTSTTTTSRHVEDSTAVQCAHWMRSWFRVATDSSYTIRIYIYIEYTNTYSICLRERCACLCVVTHCRQQQCSRAPPQTNSINASRAHAPKWSNTHPRIKCDDARE